MPPAVPSIRLKAYRRGQQDVEYLALWSRLRKQPRWAVGRRSAALNLAGTRQRTGFTGGEDAGRIDYARLRPAGPLGSGLPSARPSQRPTPPLKAGSSTSAHRAAIRTDWRPASSARSDRVNEGHAYRRPRLRAAELVELRPLKKPRMQAAESDQTDRSDRSDLSDLSNRTRRPARCARSIISAVLLILRLE